MLTLLVHKHRGGVRGIMPLLWSLSIPLLALGCTGQVSQSGPNGNPGATGGAGMSTGTGGSGGTGPATGSGGAGATAGGTTGSGGAQPAGGGPGSGTGGAVGGPPTVPATPASENAGVLPLTRLTHREFSNTMAELLGDTTAIGTTFEADTGGPAGYLAPSNVATENARQYMTAAEKLAVTAVAAGKVGLPCTTPANAAAETTCITQFITSFGARAYRRPLVKGESDDLATLFQSARTLGFTFQESVTQVVQAIIQSPNLLYHWELADQPLVRDPANNALVSLTAYQLASRLSYFLWESPPDATLLDAAATGQLSTPEGLKTQALRLLQDDRRTRKAMFNFHRQWLHVDNLEDVVSTGDLGVQLGQELEAFLSSVFVTGDGTLKTLLTAPYTYANATTAKEYGLSVTGTSFVKVDLPPAERQGVLMQVPLLRANGTAPPVNRGLVVYRQLLCGLVPAPPPDVPQVAPVSATATTRERFSQHEQLSCAKGCHGLFDPWGFAFENFDGLGHHRTTENGKLIDASGLPQANGVIGGTTPLKRVIPFKNATELVNALASSDEVSWCASKQWARYMLGRFETDADSGSLTNAYVSAAYASDRATTRPFSVRDFLVAMVTTKTFRYRTVMPGETL